MPFYNASIIEGSRFDTVGAPDGLVVAVDRASRTFRAGGVTVLIPFSPSFADL